MPRSQGSRAAKKERTAPSGEFLRCPSASGWRPPNDTTRNRARWSLLYSPMPQPRAVGRRLLEPELLCGELETVLEHLEAALATDD